VWGTHLAAQALLESADLSHVSERNQQKLALIIKWLVRVLGEERMPPAERALAGRSLAQLGDPRVEVMTVDAMEFCLVPAGPFWMGNFASPYHNDTLSYDYWMSRYPVTNAQYREFVEAGGYKEARYWNESIKEGYWKDGTFEVFWDRYFRKEPCYFGVPYSLPNHPVIGISWYGALAFVRWLNEKWHKDGILPTGWFVVLPSVEEWEKAARGGVDVVEQAIKVKPHKLGDKVKALLKPNPLPKHKYPWGDKPGEDLANCKESGINSTSAAGCFPCGVSPYGCEEMAGNVWEWTRTIGAFKKLDDERSITRVHCGASYYYHYYEVAVASGVYLGSSQHNTDQQYGFRIALSPSTLDSDPLLPLIL
jgi:formylglycine-generating enzyme required for sulfatase activity